MDIWFFYIFIGIIIAFMTYTKLEEDGVTGDQILSMLPINTNMWLREHLSVYRICVLVAFVVIIFIWPYVLYKLWYNNEK